MILLRQLCLTGLTELLHEPQGVLICYSTLGSCNQEYCRGCQALEVVEINDVFFCFCNY